MPVFRNRCEVRCGKHFQIIVVIPDADHGAPDKRRNRPARRQCGALVDALRKQFQIIRARNDIRRGKHAVKPSGKSLLFDPPIHPVHLLRHAEQQRLEPRIRLRVFDRNKPARLVQLPERDVQRFLRRNVQDPVRDIDLQVYIPDGILYVSPKETLNVPFWKLHQTSRFVSIEDAEAYPWFKALLFGVPEQMHRVDRWIEEQGLSGRFDRVFASTDIVPGSYYLELLPKGVNKGSALTTCRTIPPFIGRTMIGVGDYNNDLEMLAAADLAAVPENGHPDALKLADVVLPSNDDDAVAALIERIPELKKL